MQYNITFIPNPGTLGTLIEYKKIEELSWTTPLSSANPTMLSYFPLELDPNSIYYVRVTSIGASCSNSSVIITITTPTTNNCCPIDYILSADGTYCYKIDEVSATSPTSPEQLVAKSNKAYSTCGTVIYNPGYATTGVGSYTHINTANTYWINGDGSCMDNLITEGPMNRCALWSTSTLSNQTVGFSVCFNVPISKVYYIGVGCDDFSTIKIDGQTVVNQDLFALDASFGGTGAAFKYWHIYPVTLLSGQRVIEIIGNNGPINPAAFGAQIYDNTPAELISATADSQLNIIFNSSAYVGQNVTLGSNGIGYECPPGYSLNLCESPVSCIKITTTNTITC